MLRSTSVINNLSSHSILLPHFLISLFFSLIHSSVIIHTCSASLLLSIIYLLIRFYFLISLFFSFVHSFVIIHTDASHHFSSKSSFALLLYMLHAHWLKLSTKLAANATTTSLVSSNSSRQYFWLTTRRVCRFLQCYFMQISQGTKGRHVDRSTP